MIKYFPQKLLQGLTFFAFSKVQNEYKYLKIPFNKIFQCVKLLLFFQKNQINMVKNAYIFLVQIVEDIVACSSEKILHSFQYPHIIY